MNIFTKENWIENLRMSRETFQYLCTQLRPHIQRQDTRLRRPISVEHRLGITLWCISTCAEYWTIGHLFGVARCTVCVIVHDTCTAIATVFLDQYVKFPTGNELERVVKSFEENGT